MPAELGYTLDFLRELRHNNTRAWFTAHKPAYERARAAFSALIEDLLARFSTVDDFPGLTVGSVSYRIHRDARFSANKTPYKTNMGALFGPQGRKTVLERIYYFQVEPDESLMASGVYYLPSDALQKLRAGIARNPEPLREIIGSESFRAHFGQMTGEELKTAPRGYDRHHPAIDLLRRKQWMAELYFRDEDLLTADFADRLLETMRAARPFATYFSDILTSGGE